MSEIQLRLINDISKNMLKRGLLLVTAESCTGGWLAQLVTSLPGSSDWFDCGFVTYSNNAKHSLLGVNQVSLDDYGAVSEEVAIEMARGALDRSDAQVSISVTGVAGPDGGTQEKPVGTVWVAWAVPEKQITARCFHFTGDRESVRKQTVNAAFGGLLELLV